MTVSIHFFVPLWVLILATWTLVGFGAAVAIAARPGAKIKGEPGLFGYLAIGGPLLWLALAYAWWHDTPKTRRLGRFLVYRVGGRWVRGPAWPIWVIGNTLKVGTRRTGVLVSLRRDGLHHTPKEGDDA